MCLRLPLPCEEMPACDPVTGKATSMCWVRKAAGSPCSPRFFGDQAVPEEEKTDVCSSDGQCWPKGELAGGMISMDCFTVFVFIQCNHTNVTYYGIVKLLLGFAFGRSLIMVTVV